MVDGSIAGIPPYLVEKCPLEVLGQARIMDGVRRRWMVSVYPRASWHQLSAVQRGNRVSVFEVFDTEYVQALLHLLDDVADPGYSVLGLLDKILPFAIGRGDDGPASAAERCRLALRHALPGG